MNKWEKIIRKKLKIISYGDGIQEAFIRYARALDSSDYDVAFTKLWGVLEKLANSPGKYDPLIRRAMFLELDSERDYTRLILEHLRDMRNGLVHHDRNRDTMLTYIFQLKWFVERLFRFHLFHGQKFKSFKEVSEFLDLPPKITDLREKVEVYQKAIQFRKPRS